MSEPTSVLATALEQAEMSLRSLWLRYVGLGGTATIAQVDAHIRDETSLDEHQHDVLVHALNERFFEMDLDHPLPYSR